MVTAQVNKGYALLLALLNGVIIAVTYLSTQNTGSGITITIGVSAIIAGLEGAIHYAEGQPTTADTQTLLTTLNSTLESIKGLVTQAQQPQSSPAAQPSTTPEGLIDTYQGWNIYVRNGFIEIYPPAQYVPTVGKMMSIGSITGYPAATDFKHMARAAIDATILKVSSPTYASAGPAS
jgi:hypothetical protein